MDTELFNEISAFVNLDFQAVDKLPATGQREVFIGTNVSNGEKCVIKVCTLRPIAVGRIQREIRILSSLDSEYFPKIFFQSFITDSILLDFYESFDIYSNEQRIRLEEIKNLNIKPFLLTIEEHIPHLPWNDCAHRFKNDQALVELLIHIFQALGLLWGAQVAHRDLKPENILIKHNLRPVIIDLGIAKSFRPGTAQFTVAGNPCTPAFAAPEQLTNTRAEITYKTDQFSVGIIAFLLLTDKFPYGDFNEIEEQVIENFSTGNILSIRDFNSSANENLVRFVEKLLKVHPYQRFRNIETILQYLYEIKDMVQ